MKYQASNAQRNHCKEWLHRSRWKWKLLL